ncbi:hypothetical protein [Burkholderia sp. WAC0059]|uniref:hypothetical protein n=1 Tax=Burkholderia sp. WAC0059 TaxID=2066022 RepID=UPI0011AF9014|nr:hypothetical protein [Burkholderia sp. WAC0059]
MRIIHEPSDDAILRGWVYFREWRGSRNALLLLDALDSLAAAERLWITDRGRRPGMRREWQVLRRCVTLGILRVREKLLEAQTPAATERALHSRGRRATLARKDLLTSRAVAVALSGSSIEGAAKILEEWGMPRSRAYLKKKASELGFTKRKTAAKKTARARRQLPSGARWKIAETGASRRRVSGGNY